MPYCRARPNQCDSLSLPIWSGYILVAIWGDPSSTVDVWIESYGKAIVELSEAWPKTRAPYTLNCSGEATRYLPTLDVWTTGRSSKGGAARITNAQDAWSLYLIGNERKNDTTISFESVYQLYRREPPDDGLTPQQIARVASSEVNSLKRRLSAAGVNPDLLFESVRGKGW